MLRNTFTKKLLLHLFFTFALFLFGYNSVSAQNKNLRAGENLIVKNTNTGSRSFDIKVEKQDVISLEIKQNGVDVKVKLLSPQGLLSGEADFPFSEQETERIFVVADEDGIYRLEIEPKFSDENGFVGITLNALKKSSPADFKRAEAERLFSQAQSLRITGKTADRQKALEIYKQSLLIWREINDEIGELRALSILSYLNRILGNYRESDELAKLVLEFPGSAENSSYKSDALYQIGQMQFVSGKIDEAVKTLQESLN